MNSRTRALVAAAVAFTAAASLTGVLAGQGAAPPPAAPQGAQAGRGATYPAQQRTLAPQALIDRGKTIWSINCGACHGVDARGGDQGGPNLLRSQLVLNDQHGELILPVVRSGRPGTTMVPFTLPEADVAALAEYLHSLAAAARGRGAVPLNILVGSAPEGQSAFTARCGACHSASGDMKGIATRIADPMTLQNFWIAGGRSSGRGGGGGGAAAPAPMNPKPTTVTVTLVSGAKVDGRLSRIDDFVVSLVDSAGNTRSFTRDGDVPKVEIHDPLEPHTQLLPKYTDKEIHDITAYLVTLK